MSSLELKGGILDMIARLDNPDSLMELKNMIADFVGHHAEGTDYWEELTEEEREELEKAIKESEDESNHVSHEVVMGKYRKWLEK